MPYRQLPDFNWEELETEVEPKHDSIQDESLLHIVRERAENKLTFGVDLCRRACSLSSQEWWKILTGRWSTKFCRSMVLPCVKKHISVLEKDGDAAGNGAESLGPALSLDAIRHLVLAEISNILFFNCNLWCDFQ